MNVKCPCSKCGNGIEFESENFSPGMTTECPHCNRLTPLFIPTGTQVRKPETWGIVFISFLLFFFGCCLVFEGCSGNLAEMGRENGSAIRQTLFAVQYGFGFVVIGISVALHGLQRLIRK